MIQYHHPRRIANGPTLAWKVAQQVAGSRHQVKAKQQNFDVKHEATLFRVVALLSSDAPAVIKLMLGAVSAGGDHTLVTDTANPRSCTASTRTQPDVTTTAVLRPDLNYYLFLDLYARSIKPLKAKK